MTNILCAACRPSTYQIKTHTAKTILDKDFQLGESGTLWYLHARCYSVPGSSRDRIFLLHGRWLVFSTSPILTFPSSLLSSSWCFVRCHWLEHLLIKKKMSILGSRCYRCIYVCLFLAMIFLHFARSVWTCGTKLSIPCLQNRTTTCVSRFEERLLQHATFKVNHNDNVAEKASG